MIITDIKTTLLSVPFEDPPKIGFVAMQKIDLLILEIETSIIPRMLEMRAAGGRLQRLCCAALVRFWSQFLEFCDISNLRN